MTTASVPRGCLRIFLGEAPGVGKTQAMLRAALRRKGEGVIAFATPFEVIDPALTPRLEELTRVPPREVGGAREVDIDAVLKLRPRLVLIEDMAHVNTGGSWHPRRYQDIEQILDAGIDVTTTLNVESIESLGDIVAQIGRLRVAETVPDSVVARAGEVTLVDMPPEEVLERYAAGKVARASDRSDDYYTIGNLTALRELALRFMAERVDQQMLHHRQSKPTLGVWPTRERLLVCIGEAEVVSRLVRIGKRAADRRKMPWIALYVETHAHAGYSEIQRGRIEEALRLAEQLGAEIVRFNGDDPAEEILAYARTRNVTQIIIGKSERSRWMAALSPSVTDRILHQDANIDVLVVTPDDSQPRTRSIPVKLYRTGPGAFLARLGRVRWSRYGKAVWAVALASLISFVIGEVSDFHNFAIIYLTAVMLVAIRQGRWPAMFAAVVTGPVYRFLFVDPRLTLSNVTDIDPISLIIFLGAAAVISNLAGRVRAQISATRLSERRSKNLYDFNRKVAAAAGLDDVLWAVVHHVASTISGKALVMLPMKSDPERLEISAAYPPEMALEDNSEAAADWAWRQGKMAGRGSNTLPHAEWFFVPLRTARGPLGVLGVQTEGKARMPFAEEARLLDTLSDQAAVAIERTKLVADFEETRLLRETEKLRTALLSSLSHDLRTPLVSILGAATTLLELGDSLDRPVKRDLMETIREEAERLNRFVQNLLDMTRLGSGALHPKFEWVEIGDVVGAALARLKRQIGQRHIEVSIPAGLPILHLDFVLMEQVFVNIIDNASKYSGPESRIGIRAEQHENEIRVFIDDEGHGIPASEREKVFDMFYRVRATDSQAAGTGLGLAICRGIVEAHGGRVRVIDRADGRSGSEIEITLPVRAAPELTETE